MYKHVIVGARPKVLIAHSKEGGAQDYRKPEEQYAQEMSRIGAKRAQFAREQQPGGDCHDACVREAAVSETIFSVFLFVQPSAELSAGSVLKKKRKEKGGSVRAGFFPTRTHRPRLVVAVVAVTHSAQEVTFSAGGLRDR